jgi:hypothetical protein
MIRRQAAKLLEKSILRRFEGYLQKGLAKNDAYRRTCIECSANRYFQLLLRFVRRTSHSKLEAYVVYILSKQLQTAQDKPFMPVIWASGNAERLLGTNEKTLVFSVHNNFSFALVTLSARAKVMALASNTELLKALYDRSGGNNFHNVIWSSSENFPLVNFMRDAQITFYSCHVDQRRNSKSRIDGYKFAPFEMAQRLSVPVFFAHFEFTQEGVVLGHIDGPFKDVDALELIDRFAKFVGVLKRYRIYRAPHARKKPAKN